MSQLSKSELRRTILKQRESLSAAEWQIKSSLIGDRLRNLPLFKEAKTILAYFSFRQEADLTPLFLLNKNWCFPRCVNKSLIWHLWHPGKSFSISKYGIKEPLKTAPIITPQSADLILVPTVACDQQGHRLGYGGGFYDRLLISNQCSCIPTIGIVYDFAYISQLPIDPWDIKLDFICTESKYEQK